MPGASGANDPSAVHISEKGILSDSYFGECPRCCRAGSGQLALSRSGQRGNRRRKTGKVGNQMSKRVRPEAEWKSQRESAGDEFRVSWNLQKGGGFRVGQKIILRRE